MEQRKGDIAHTADTFPAKVKETQNFAHRGPS